MDLSRCVGMQTSVRHRPLPRRLVPSATVAEDLSRLTASEDSEPLPHGQRFGAGIDAGCS
jgi:hypothetical protein